MKYLNIDNQLFINNRQKLKSRLAKNDLAIFNSNDIMPTNADGTMPFRQNNDLFWLSGVDQEESILIIYPDNSNEQEKEILFLKETSELIAIWEGAKLSKSEAFATSGIKSVYWLNEFEGKLNSLMKKCDGVYLNENVHSRATSEVETRDDRFRNMVTHKFSEKEIKQVAPIMHDLRSIKSETEIALIQNACNITESGFRRILPFIKPGIMEYEIEAELIHEFLRNRSSGFAYAPILGAGRNSCVLHYGENNNQCQDGNILLMDFGAEYANYASDMTRTVPVNGRFSERQKAVYNSVLHVMREATNMLRPGTVIDEYHKEVGKIMESELITLGLLDRHDVKNQDPKKPLFRKYFMHGTSHYLGLDVHDVGDFSAPMQKGMVFTCEPGIYILNEELGVRLENDLLVTDDKAFDLMKNIPIEIEEIEDLMNA
tara:strand:+ start:930 stop:2219 length:1290 start_codon:yes stop_codon:yes gene_type:complete